MCDEFSFEQRILIIITVNNPPPEWSPSLELYLSLINSSIITEHKSGNRIAGCFVLSSSNKLYLMKVWDMYDYQHVGDFALSKKNSGCFKTRLMTMGGDLDSSEDILPDKGYSEGEGVAHGVHNQ